MNMMKLKRIWKRHNVKISGFHVGVSGASKGLSAYRGLIFNRLQSDHPVRYTGKHSRHKQFVSAYRVDHRDLRAHAGMGFVGNPS